MQIPLSKACRTKTVRRALFRLAAALMLLAFFSPAASSRIIDGIAIIVNKEAVLVSEVNEAMRPLIQEYRAKYAGADLKRKMAELRETVIEQAIDTKLILQVAKVNKIMASDETVDARIDVVKRRFPSEEEFLQALAAKGMTLREFREQVAEQVLVQDTIKRVLGARISVQDDEMLEYYESHQDEFETRPKVELAQIFIKIPSGSAPEEVERLGQKAEELRILIEEGTEFSELARKYSEGPYREKNGVIGVVGHEEILPDLEKIAFGLKTGDVSPVVQTAYGFHILKAIEAMPARKIGFEEAKPLIEDRINEIKRSEKYDDWMKMLREDSFIDIRI